MCGRVVSQSDLENGVPTHGRYHSRSQRSVGKPTFIVSKGFLDYNCGVHEGTMESTGIRLLTAIISLSLRNSDAFSIVLYGQPFLPPGSDFAELASNETWRN